MTSLSKEEDNKPVRSDHVVIRANINIEWLREETIPWTIKKQTFITNAITEEDIISILLDPRFPHLSFHELADERNLVEVRERKRSLLDTVNDLEKKFAKNSEDRTNLMGQINNLQ